MTRFTDVIKATSEKIELLKETAAVKE